MASIKNIVSPGGIEVTVAQLLVFLPSIIEDAALRAAEDAGPNAEATVGLDDYFEAAVLEIPYIVLLGWALYLTSPVVFPGGDRTRKVQAGAAGFTFVWGLDFSEFDADMYYENLAEAAIVMMLVGQVASRYYTAVTFAEQVDTARKRAVETGGSLAKTAGVRAADRAADAGRSAASSARSRARQRL